MRCFDKHTPIPSQSQRRLCGDPGKLVNVASVWILCNMLLIAMGGPTYQPPAGEHNLTMGGLWVQQV